MKLNSGTKSKFKAAAVLAILSGLIAPQAAVAHSQGDPVSRVILNETRGQQQARLKAKSYISIMAFSFNGLVDQLKFDGFSTSEAKYGVTALKANWNAQAAKKARSYLKLMSFSRQGLIDQLVFDGFTVSQATYGAKAAGY
mgnify:CR=1 FL=1|jgi:NADH dehydrogenase FAD-containing subunit